MSLAPRKRRTDRNETPSLPVRSYSDDDKQRTPKPHLSAPSLRNEYIISWSTATALTVVACIVRFWRIAHPDQVVFDEVHFGSFAAQYIKREYYFDVHPPLAKMLNGLAAWFVGFDGNFGFDQIGDSYTDAGIPYVGMRSFCAILGTLTIPVVYAIMRESGYPVGIAAFSAALILFDNGHITQTRLILLDAALVLFMALSLFCYVKFHQYRYQEFSRAWWGWLLATGFWLACTLGCKMVGLFTFATIGAAVLWDLWEILDIKRGHSMSYWTRHFCYRAIGLVIVPFFVYLSFFWAHFRILKFSGPGDSFMSPAFQETLQGNELLLNAQEIRYYDTITLRHKDTKQYLHSHEERYPLRYDDGRISSQGQQVTCYPHNDTNNHWQVIPTKEIPESGRGRIVRHNDVIQLKHINTQTLLLTHDVASPLMPTNQEFTTVSPDKEDRRNDTLFKMVLNDAHDGEAWKTLSGHFRLIHVPTKVALWTHPKALPEWAFGQQEVNGNKNAAERSTLWFVNDIVEDGQGIDFKNRTVHVEPKAVKKRAFIKKWFELQVLMLQHNAGLTSTHPYQSTPIEWPFCLSGISFWTRNEGQQQIYMIGNLLAWWICAVSVSVYVGVVAADMLARRRGIHPIEDGVRNRLYRNTGFFLGAWAFHYFPFYLMGRQRFLHHYLPAHLASVLVAGSVMNFILIEAVNYPISVAGPTTRLRPAVRAKLNRPAKMVIAGLLVVVIGVYLFLSPLTYGQSMTGEEVNRRKLLSTWSLHFEAKKTHSMDE
ncbi:dolichyl-phosphate-mannose-protein mannosyltransferase [Cryptococcus neoformans]|nr:dolichyl-phosphate-mannose-protein mannosyltransferase [Cryptococcus neoformans var. grubii 125.91]OXG50178.1 dolichyl-phosphate-mannose-protein mannosyltransferase [Cryptococcus neoformans var. grubii Th84]OXH11408.1 dolichyl-phosphate-mannose-protein mannosyltransferase [Cryptococcus neoformans var. grubii]OXH32260.1 dolichyl-phosphate-mannose-protein mannosyltransferase [Cryptococcus neoformans var. grubii]OXH52670.1 dolichyl-phosphate-mannose-protein mannosyltransferase [Cryptococcus neo